MTNRVIVVLEDDEGCRRVYRRMLQMGGYECVEAQTADEVLAYCRNRSGAVSGLIADLALQTCRGTDVALASSRACAGLKVLFVSGTPLECWPESDVRKVFQLPLGSYAFLEKPFQVKTLLGRLDELLNCCYEVQHA
jgi:DNA-binding NtrC family response regulator